MLPFKREWPDCRSLRASNEHILIVRVLRARKTSSRSLSFLTHFQEDGLAESPNCARPTRAFGGRALREQGGSARPPSPSSFLAQRRDRHAISAFCAISRKHPTLESTNSNQPGDRDARHRSADLAPILSVSGSDDSETSVIRRGITAFVWLDKAQERRYYRRHSGR